MKNVSSKIVVLFVASLLISGQIANTIYAKQPPEMRKAEVVYDDGKFGMTRVPMDGDKKGKSSKKSLTGTIKNKNVHPLKPGTPHSLKPALPPGTKPVADPFAKLGVSPLYTDNDGGYYSSGDISVYAAYTSYTEAASDNGDTYWPVLAGDMVYVYTAFHSDVATKVDIVWDLNWHDVVGYQNDHATWDYDGEILDSDYWYYAYYHPDNVLPIGYYSVYTSVTSQTNNDSDSANCEFRVTETDLGPQCSADSEETNREDGRAVNACDGNPDTFWHTQWSGASTPGYPHWFERDLGTSQDIYGLKYLPRQDSSTNGTIRGYGIYVDGVLIISGEFSCTGKNWRTVNFPAPVNGQVIKLVATSPCGSGQPWASAAEIETVLDFQCRADSEETNREDGRAVNACDGDPDTFWHTQWSGASTPGYPHWFERNLGTSQDIYGLKYLPRQDSGTNGTIRGYEIYVDGVHIISGEFSCTGKNWRTVNFPAPVNGQVIKLVATSPCGSGQPWASAAEIEPDVTGP